MEVTVRLGDYVFETHVRPISEGTESWQYSYNVPDTIPSSFTATVSGTDTYGNAYSGTDSLSFEIEHVAPTVILSHSDQDNVVAQSEQVTFNALFSNTLKSTLLPFQSLRVTPTTIHF